ncbi:MAG TPA: M12 family metallo-peptidase [Phycisphaerae bacterium]|nr:M12 family metallo-peptidase [Phycisphaerae bacterium]
MIPAIGGRKLIQHRRALILAAFLSAPVMVRASENHSARLNQCCKGFLTTLPQSPITPPSGLNRPTSKSLSGSNRTPPSGCDDGTVIDILVVYTTQARSAAGGIASIESKIAGAISDANTAFANSLIDTSLNLVHSAEVAYTETGDSATDGAALLAGAGALAAAHTLRDQYSADLVALWVNSLEVGGRVFAPTNPSGYSGFQEMRWTEWDLYTLAHETGHNLGCAHDPDHAFNDAYFPYSYGYVDPGNNWHTIMAVFQPNPGIPYFSNPNVNYLGTPTGNAATADNAHTINQTRHIVANYRLAPVAGLPAVLRVNSAAAPGGDGLSWATAFINLQDGVAQAIRSRGDVEELWVAAGNYKPDNGTELRQMSFRLQRGVGIYGGFNGTETLRSQRDWITNPTILDGEIGAPGDATDNSQHVVVAEDVDATAVLDGFTIRNGNADIETVFFTNTGGGMRNQASTPTIANCRFEDNSAAWYGGGMYNDSASPTVSACAFISNAVDPTLFPGGGAMANRFGSAPQVTDTTFSLNFAGYVGGAVYHSAGATTFSRCIFDTNHSEYGGAIALDGSSPTFLNCGFYDNLADTHGGAFDMVNGSNPVIAGCIFSYNTATANYGGAMTTFANSSPSIVNCTFVGNYAGFVGGAIANDSNGPTLANSILRDNGTQWGTSQNDQLWSFTGAINVQYCSIQGWTGSLGGIGNNGDDPRFIDPDGQDNATGTPDDDLRLRPGSPSIDSGSNSFIPVALTTDFGGLMRRTDIPAIADTGAGTPPIVDRGAHEFTAGQCQSGDFSANGLIDNTDVAPFAVALVGPPPASCIADLNNDGWSDGRDIRIFTALLMSP